MTAKALGLNFPRTLLGRADEVIAPVDEPKFGERSSMKAVQIATFGKPLDVARCVDVADVEPPGWNEVVIAVEASPINQYDF